MELEEIKQEMKKAVPKFTARVAPVYKLLDWKWCDQPHIPDEKEIQETLYGLIDELGKNGYFNTGTGGLIVAIDKSSKEYTLSMSIDITGYWK